MSYSSRIRRAKLEGFGGRCQGVALAINRAVFGGRGCYVVASNALVEQNQEPLFFGHVAVKYRGRLYDSRGEVGFEDVESWGELDASDPDLAEMQDESGTREGFEEAASEAVVYEMNEREFLAEIKKAYGRDGLKDILFQAERDAEDLEEQ